MTLLYADITCHETIKIELQILSVQVAIYYACLGEIPAARGVEINSRKFKVPASGIRITLSHELRAIPR